MKPDEATNVAVTVARYASDDYDAVYGLWERSDLWMRPSDGRHQVALKQARDPGLFLVAWAGRDVVGSVRGGWDGRRGYVYHLAVDPAWRRRGVAGRLMDELEVRLQGRGALKVKLQVLDGNEAARHFFARRGYEVETICIPYGRELSAGGAPLAGAPGGEGPPGGPRGAPPAHDRHLQGDEDR